MNETRIFRKLLEAYAKATQAELGLIVRPSGVIQFVAGNNVNINLTMHEQDKWITVIGDEIFRKLTDHMRAIVPDRDIEIGEDEMDEDPDLS